MLKNKILYIIVLSFLPVYVFCQINDIDNYSNLSEIFNDVKIETGASFNTFLSSNSINSDFISALYGKKYIDNDLKASNSLKTNNYIWNADHGNIYFCHKPDSFLGSADIGYRIGLSYHSQRDIKFTDDLFNLIFYGNKRFAGDTADLSNFQLNMLTYQELQMGVFQKTTLYNNPFYYYIGLSFIKGQDYQSLKFRDAGIYTAETGEYIDLSLSMTYQAMDTVKTKFEDFNGIGAGVNVYFKYEDVSYQYFVEAAINNIGFIRWKNQSLTFPIDTNHRFEGIEIDNIFSYNDSNYFELHPDSIIEDFYDHADTGTIIKALPERISFSVTKLCMQQKLLITAGMGYYYNANQRMPLFYLKSKYYFKPYFSASLLAGYGGYGNFHLGTGLNMYLLKNKLKISVLSNNILGFIVPEYSFTQNLYFSLSYRL